MRALRALVLLAGVVACQTSDLTLPAPPAKAQPGTVYGRVVYAKAGQSTPIPAAGASVVLLGTSLSATSKSDGNFLISGITQSTGTLLFRFDSTGSGMVDHQRAIQLQDIGAGEGRQIGLGDVAVTQNATMHGKVKLGDKPDAVAGLGGTTVFVPAGPFTTYTNDDGSYRLDNLPEGVIHVTFFHTGYDAYDLANVSLRAGEDFPVADIVLTPQATPPPPGNIHGRITFVPQPDHAETTVVSAADTGGHSYAGQVSADASFSIQSVPAGLYDITVAHVGYSTAVIHNILVGSAADITLPQVTLQAGNGTVDCIPDAACTPTTACHTGKVSCTTGTAVCVDSGLSDDGTVCGANKYCHTGTCGDCAPGTACDPTGAICHTGAISCTTGLPVCVDTQASKDDGTICGANQVCKTGRCTACEEGIACTPSENVCHTGSIVCSTGSPVCLDTQGARTNGLTCGPDMVCSAGSCVSCVAGGACVPAAASCHRGTYACDTGFQLCVDSGTSLDDGTSCGANKYCNAGACVSCTPGTACNPSPTSCHTGSISCMTGTPVCEETTTNKDDGTSCGTDQVCKAGVCTSCQEGLSCTPTEAPCHTGSISCSTGSPVCVDTQGTLSNGTSCGTDKVCSGGSCISCAAGGVCSPTTAVCHHGTFACNTGVQICVDDHTNLDDGTTCGQDKVCNGGGCVACVTGAACVPDANICHAGVTSCVTGASQCLDTQAPATDGTPCGTQLVCHASQCVPSGFSIVSGDAQSVNIVSAAAPVVIQLNNQNGGPIIGAAITVTSPDGGAATVPPSGVTDANGQYIFAPIMPRDPGSHTWTVATANDHIVVTATALAPPASVSFPVVNLDHNDSSSGVPGPGLLAHVGSSRGLVVASDGSVYFSDWDQHRVRRLSPTGQLTNIAGSGSAGFSGDGQAATGANLYYPYGVALDEAHQHLYVADYSNNAVRDIDLRTGLISTIAGRGSASGPGYGDGGSALGAVFSSPTHLSLGPDGRLYVTDSGHGRVRVIDLQAHTISAWLSPPGNCPSDKTTWLYSCSGYYTGCALAWDAMGNAYVSGTFVGTDFGPACYSTSGIAQVTFASDGSPTFTHVAGYYNGVTNEGAPATSTALPGMVLMDFDAQGNLFLSSPDAHTIRRIDASSGRITTFAGTAGTYTYSPPFTAAASTKLYNPHQIAFDPTGNLLVSDYGNSSILQFSPPASTTPTTTTLTKTGGDGQTVVVNQQATTFLSVKLTDDTGPLAGYPVRWTSVDEGAFITASVVPTDLNGISSVAVRVGRKAGAYRFRASYLGLGGTPATGSPITFTLTATAPTAGNIYTLVNVLHTYGSSATPVPGSVAKLGAIYDPIVASDGTIYFSDQSNYRVWKLSPGGQLDAVAGNGTCGSAGDGGLALQAQICDPWGLALDETSNTLYIADTYTNTIRAVNLTTGILSRFAGGGSAGAPDWGDGSPATSAAFQDLSHLSLGPDHALYVADQYQARIRRIDLTTGAITNWLRAAGTGTTPYAFNGCGSGSYWSGCNMAWDSAGNAYVSGYISGTALSCSNAFGVLYVNTSDGSISLVAGACSGTTSAGAPGPATSFDTAPTLALDASGNVYIAHGHSHTIERIDAGSGVVRAVAGARGTASFAGEVAPASSALFNAPSGIAFDPDGNLIIADNQNYALRAIAGIATTTPEVVTLAKNGGDGQSVVVDQLAATPLSVKLSGTSGALTGYTVRWTSLDTGAVLSAGSTDTDGNGVAATSVRLGRKPGTYRFKARFTDIHGNDVSGSPLTFTLTATAPPIGHIYTAVNLAHAYGNSGENIAGVMARINAPNNVIAASDNSLYIADGGNRLVWKLSPEGILTVVAGNGQCGKGGDGGQARSAQICTPWGLALDEAANLLYIGDDNSDNVRVVNLSTGIISLFAGNGSIGTPTYGDGDVATNAQFSSVTHLRIGPDDQLYVTDPSMGRIRVINRTTKQIQTWMQTGSCNSAPVVVADCGSGSLACEVRWDATGNAFVSGTICGTDLWSSGTGGIIRVNAADQSRVVVVGNLNGSTTLGVQATEAKLPYAPAFALDAAGNLFLTSYYGHMLYRVDGTNGQLTQLAGNASAGYAGDEVVSTSAIVNYPAGLDIGPNGDLFFADNSNHAIRTIANVAGLTGGGAQIALSGVGNGLTVYVNQQLPQSPAMAVKVTSTAGAPLVGYRVHWKSLDTGGVVLASSSVTDANGVATAQGRVGLTPGTYRFEASFQDTTGADVSGSPVTFTQTAVAPDAGDIFTVLNAAHTRAAPGGTGSAALAVSGQITDLALAPDGSIYFADNAYCVVRAISPEGIVTTVAGISGSCGYTGNSGPATSAKIQNATGVAVDPTNTNLYISDASNNVVRRVDLTTGIIYAYAGGGTAGSPDWGDESGTALQAAFSYPTHLAFGPNPVDHASGPVLYITDLLHERIRWVDGAGYIHKFLAGNTNSSTNGCATAPAVLRDCYYTSAGGYDDCQVTWDSANNAYVSGTITGTGPSGNASCNYTSGILRIDYQTGAVTHVAGKVSGSTTDGALATTAIFSAPPTMAIDASGNVYTIDPAKHQIRRIDHTTGTITTLAGTGTAGYLGDYAISTGAQVSTPWYGLFDANGHFVFADQNNYAIREIW